MSADAPIELSSDDDEDAPAPAPTPAAAPAPAPPAPAPPVLLADDGTRVSGLYIATSSIPGLDEPGLFTSKAIAPGGFVAIYTPGVS